ncbi:TolC family protein [Desulfobacter latus]|uniref:TolC family protein n=1 Tax=Desulfobacter latus TaxID=2292 RepID=A0A850T5B5_9BACT|nr:TolC family protein [Desulfobacter latus]NWH03457.1 TolC family protein [Desulfobacter latus]
MKKTLFAVMLVMGGAVFLCSPRLWADSEIFNPSPEILMSNLLTNHEEIRTYRQGVKQAQGLVRQSRGLYYPSLNLYGDTGFEKIDKEYHDDTDEFRHQVTLRGTQLITDFGKTTGTIKKDRLFLEQSKATLELTRQRLMRDGIAAYINIVKARERIKTAQYSEARIKELTGIEKTLVEKGAGLSSNVLQAKSHLAGAMALRVKAQGELEIAQNRFQALFYHFPTNADVNTFQKIAFPGALIPGTLDDSLAQANKAFPEIQISRLDLEMGREAVQISKSTFYPTLNLFAEAIHADNDNGSQGERKDYSTGIEFQYNLFNGGSDTAAVKSALAIRDGASSRLEHIKKQVREQVRNSWNQLATLRQRKELLDQQTDILKNFLELAKKERTMGVRPLLDVLSGEVNYINARGEAIAAQEDMKIAAFNLIYAMGAMNIDIFTP